MSKQKVAEFDKPVRTIRYTGRYSTKMRVLVPQHGIVELDNDRLNIYDGDYILLASFSGVTDWFDESLAIQRQETSDCGCATWKVVE